MKSTILWLAGLLCLLAGFGTPAPEPGYWIYNGSLPVRRCTEVWGYGYEWMNDRQKQAFDLLYGEYFSDDVRPDGLQSRYFTLPAPLTTVEFKNVVHLYEMATDCYGYRALRYTFGDGEAACKNPLCVHRLPNRELHVMVTALAYENEALNRAYDQQIVLADALLSGMEPGLSEAEKCEYIFRTLCARTAYYTDPNQEYTSTPVDLNGIECSSYNPAYPFVTAYGALKNGLANCSGYALAFDLLAKRAGLTCLVVQGFQEQDAQHMDGHAWNMVQINGKWYQVDAARGDLAERGIDWSCFLFGESCPWHAQYSVRNYGHRAVELPECQWEPCPYTPKDP